jgi:hypothetical protein
MVRGRLDRSTRAWREWRRAAAARSHLAAHRAHLQGQAEAVADLERAISGGGSPTQGGEGAIPGGRGAAGDAGVAARVRRRLEEASAARVEMELLVEREAPERQLLESVRW